MAADFAGLMVPAALLAMAESFAGQRLVIDERLLLPVCPAPHMDWVTPAGPPMVAVRCDQPAWRVFLPVAAPEMRPATAPGRVKMVDAPAAPVAPVRTVRRGERVLVLVRGAGFSVSLEAVAEGPARDGRLWVRAPGGDGRRMLGRMEPDGAVIIDGLNIAVNGR